MSYRDLERKVDVLTRSPLARNKKPASAFGLGGLKCGNRLLGYSYLSVLLILPAVWAALDASGISSKSVQLVLALLILLPMLAIAAILAWSYLVWLVRALD